MSTKSLKKSSAVGTYALLLFFFSSHLTLAELQELPEVQTYDRLVDAIRDSRRSTHPENKREKVREAWTLGKLIELHAAEYTLWADYHAYLNKKLSQDLNIKWEDLLRMRRFARSYPDAVPAQDLDWWHFIVLMTVHDPVQRETLAARDEKEKWTDRQLRAELGKLREKNQTPLGPSRSSVLLEKLNYYAAAVTQVLDGDTFDAVVDLGFGLTAQQRFRFRGLDAPEADTRKGIAAKEFLVDQIRKIKGRVILKVVRQDKYGRYVADVWIPNVGDPNYVHLNQKLIDEGLATAVRN